jgi:hypothetical protein
MKWVARKTEPDAKVMVTDDALFMKYYAHRSPLSRPVKIFVITAEELTDFRRDLDQTLDDEIPVYATSAGIYLYDPEMKFSNFVNEHYTLKIIGSHPIEDWHTGEMFQKVGRDYLFKIEEK